MKYQSNPANNNSKKVSSKLSNKGLINEYSPFEISLIKVLSVIGVLGFIIYLRIVSFDVVGVDEDLLLNYNNKNSFIQLFQKGVFEDYNASIKADYYRPVLTSSFKLESLLPGKPYKLAHFFNIILHILSSFLLYKFFAKIHVRKELALFFSLLFTVHPLLTQAVAWIPGRNDSLLAITVLSSLLFFLNYVNTKNIRDYILHNVFFLAALLTKETGIMVPVICVLLHFLIIEDRINIKKLISFVLVWPISVVIWYFLRTNAIGNSLSLGDGIVSNSISKLPILFNYLGKAIFPFNLSVFPVIEDLLIWPGILALLLIGVGVFLSKDKNYKRVILGASWFIIFLIPVIILPDEVNKQVFEHRMYVPLIGVLIILNETVLFDKRFFKLSRLVVAGGVIIVIFSAITISHSSNFKNKLVFFENAVETSPSGAWPYVVVGSEYFVRGNQDKAEQYFRKAYNLNPKERLVNYSLGTILKERKQYPEAIEFLEREVALDPRDSVYYNIGFSYYGLNKLEEAKTNYLKVLSLNPDYIDAYQALSIISAQQGEYKKALEYALEVQKRGRAVPAGVIEDLKSKVAAEK